MPHPLDPDWTALDHLDRHLISVGWDRGLVKVCQLQFYRNGLFVHFPYHPSETGVVARCMLRAGIAQQEVSYADTGFVVSHKVKYSHPADGRAHFSQDGRIRTTVRGQAGPIADSAFAGHLFTVDVQGLQHFRGMTDEDYHGGQYGRALFDVPGDDPPALVHITGFWQQPGPAVVDRLRNPITVRSPDGSTDRRIALAPPRESPLHGAIVVVNAVAQERLDRRHDHMLLFTGGFDPALRDPASAGSFLLLVYPADETEGLPTIDYDPHE